MTRLDHYTAAGEVSLYTAHSNLITIFDPYGRNPGLSLPTANKLMHWALKLCAYRYAIEHLPSWRNVWTDTFTRSSVRPKARMKMLKIARFLCSSSASEFRRVWLAFASGLHQGTEGYIRKASSKFQKDRRSHTNSGRSISDFAKWTAFSSSCTDFGTHWQRWP